MNEPYILILLGLMGVVFRLLLKMQSLQGAANSANVKFGWPMYWKKDRWAIIASVVSVAIWFWIFGEWAKKYPAIDDFKRTGFVFFGYGGASVIQTAFDKYTQSAIKYIRTYGDIKSNISDIAAGIKKTDSIDMVIEKGKELTGTDVTIAPPAPKEVDIPKDSDIKPQ